MKREQKYLDLRRDAVLKLLREEPEITIPEIAQRLNVSIITIRRDLQYLEDQKKLFRFYGGARLCESEEETEDEVSVYRRAIAKFAATLVEDGDTFFINTSRNALSMLKYVTAKNVIAITNNGRAITAEKGEGVSVILTGGELRYPKEAMVGDFALRNLQTVFPKKAFIGCTGFSVKAGMTTEIANEVRMNQAMIENARNEVYLLADHTKIGHCSAFISCEVQQIKHLITDEKASAEELMLLREAGVNVMQVSKDGMLS